MTSDPKYLHGHHDSVLRSHRWRTAENSARYFTGLIQPDWVILDVGCGPGTITADLNELVPDGVVVGLDMSPTVLAQARELTPRTPLVAADLYALPFEPGSVDAIHLHMVLQHIPDPVGALRAMATLLKPGGVIAARDSDYGAFSWTPDAPALTRWLELYRATARVVGGEPDAGQYLGSWAEQAGLKAETSWSSWVYESPEDRAWWGSLWADRIVSSAFAGAVLDAGLAEKEELEELSRGWRAWAAEPKGRFELPCGEVICRR
jgi:SAM-dependent methyltransferase